MILSLALAVTLATFTSVATPQTDADHETTLREAWVGELDLGSMKARMQFRILDQADGDSIAYFDSISENRRNMKATVSMEDGSLEFDVAVVGLKYHGQLDEAGLIATGTFEQAGRKFPLTLKRQATEYQNLNTWENRPQRPAGPFPYTAAEVTFENQQDEVTLAGTLTLPEGTAKVPAVILISGSGPQDRDESFMEHKPFLVLADYLSRRGIAVLRYDDRGTAKSTGDFGPATSEDFARDTGSAFEFLRSHPRIDAKNIGLIGHSEGGLIAPMVAVEYAEIAFIILLAGPGIDGAQISQTQSVAMNRAAGLTEGEVQALAKIQTALFEVLKESPADAELAGKLKDSVFNSTANFPESARDQVRATFVNSLGSLTSPWFNFFVKYDTSVTLAKVQCPVLAMNGERDIQVIADFNLPAIEAALAKGGNKNFEIVLYPKLNHMFQVSETGAMGEYASIQETIHPPVMEKISEWIDEQVN